MSNLHLVEIKESSIDGKGVFARTIIDKKVRIGRYLGEFAQRNGKFVLWITDEENGKVFGIKGKNKLRYLNHSSTPNAEFEGDTLYTITPIQKGEEVTIHYGVEFKEYLKTMQN